jgi:predicted phage-related endonuclease
MPTNKNVLKDRDKYIGGSEISTILGINPFESRYELLLDKSGIEKNEFTGNDYTEYGDVIEGVIRDYINKEYGLNFIEYTIAKDYDDTIGDRCNYDGYDEEQEITLEIKSTSQIYEDLKDYKKYIVQQLWGLMLSPFKRSVLAVYERDEKFKEKTPEQWVKDFDPSRLHIYKINIDDYTDYVEEIKNEVPKFKQDLKALKENPLMSEYDFLPVEVKKLNKKVIAFENKLEAIEQLQQQVETFREKLYEIMEQTGVKKWTTTNGITITRVNPIAPSTKIVEQLNEKKLKEQYENAYNDCLEQVEKKSNGKKGYITMKKESK